MHDLWLYICLVFLRKDRAIVGAASPFEKYILSLPTPDEVLDPLHWEKDEVERYLRHTKLFLEVEKIRGHLGLQVPITLKGFALRRWMFAGWFPDVRILCFFFVEICIGSLVSLVLVSQYFFNAEL